jgi:hypothetical protein
MLRDNAILHKLVALAIATTITTSFWVLVLTAVSYAFGITISTLFLVGFGLAIVVVSGLGLVAVMDRGGDASTAYEPTSQQKEDQPAREAGGVMPGGSASAAPNR